MSAELHVGFDRCNGYGRCYSQSPKLVTYGGESFESVRPATLPSATTPW